MKDKQGGQLKCRRAKTAMQRDRNICLKKAFESIKSVHKNDIDVEFDWESRRITVKGVTAYKQDKEGLGGAFASPFETCTF